MINVTEIWLTDSAVWIRTEDGREAKERFSDYPRLKYATEEQRCNFVSDADGIHWPELDEDLCFESFFDKKDQTILYRIFIEHPELNASAIARRLGISQSLFAQYISGAKKPSEARLNQILEQIRALAVICPRFQPEAPDAEPFEAPGALI